MDASTAGPNAALRRMPHHSVREYLKTLDASGSEEESSGSGGDRSIGGGRRKATTTHSSFFLFTKATQTHSLRPVETSMSSIHCCIL